MSHVVTVQSQMKDPVVLAAACQRLNLAAPVRGQHKLYQTTVSGLGVKLPDWSFPVVVREDGSLAYDNFGGAWGDQKELDKLQQSYAVETGKAFAQSKGYQYQEQTLDDGAIKLTMQVGSQY